MYYFISLFTYFLRPNAPNTVCTRLTSEYPSKSKTRNSCQLRLKAVYIQPCRPTHIRQPMQ